MDINNQDNKPLNLDNLNDIVVPKIKLDRLCENTKLMTLLKNKSLQKIIKHIDSTRYKKNTLEKMLKDNDFRLFADEILDSLGYLKDKTFTY